MKRWATIAMLAMILTVAGCGPRAEGETGVGSTPAGSIQTPAVIGASTESVGAASEDELDIEAIDRQLDAMQSELDELQMPSDSDFEDADSAVY
jgi:hypothetical protein